MLKKGILSSAICVFLGGCQLTGPSAICTPDTKVNLDTAEVPVQSSEDRRVIVLPVDINFDDMASDQITEVLRQNLETQIADSGSNLVDRSVANKLKQEIKLAEQSGKYNVNGVPIADMAIITEVTASDFSKKFSEAFSYVNDDGERISVPAKCNYKVTVTATSKVVTIPDMKLVKRVTLVGDETKNTNTRNSNCPMSEIEYTGMASKAAKEAVEYNREFAMMLAPSAPVRELRICEAGTMVKIGMGSNKQVTPGAEIAFSKIIMNDDGEAETFAAGEGTVVDIPQHGIKENYAWVSIDEETALKIKEGDAARVIPEGCAAFDFECHANELGVGDLGLDKLGLPL
ncbi:hypothetical protein HGP28_03715 [Vibrio sp. SM6]|uniref:Lipoprotein n=1 Tax=Vibrio agarilyticus TaxID=2726741 RepID=A0A7X8TPT4_9VIBR|nr:hypothetical protein [Vibrio agarilyticus]NLS11998.1 hypothetical protein [Vibrio agarilyticus]